MKIMVIGSGGREHALCWKLSRSPQVESIICAPGNGGTANTPRCSNLDAVEVEEQVRAAVDERIDLVIIGPEAPLVDGLADLMRAEGIPTVGPGSDAAVLEGSKAAAKEFMVRHGIRTAEYRRFEREEGAAARDYVRSAAYPLVIKADGLAAGKGVTICETVEEALATIRRLFEDDFLKESGRTIVIEQFLDGREVSILTLCDGSRGIPLISAMDHKRIGENDIGPNTGGMGAIAPNPFFTKELREDFEEAILKPTLRGLKADGLDYRGIIFFGLMLHGDRNYLLEYNVRFGDPETQAVLPLLDEDLADLMLRTAEGRLEERSLNYLGGAACNVVMASGGYPGKYEVGEPIRFSIPASGEQDLPGVSFFIAGARQRNGVLETSGGRVLSVTGIGDTPEEALARAYEAAGAVDFKGKYLRRDIGTT
ncbi:MAG: phosphoribosylamine--glycine ligase [Spirochaetota bacterium]|nr:phosphoribosylamine--glycine ligase [Spirochaetota bacterium]